MARWMPAPIAYAHWALSLGLKQGDCVALFMENRPDFLCAWLGLFKAGLCAALINTNQRGQPLAHSIQIAGARHVIAGEELAACLPEAEAFFDHQAANLDSRRREIISIRRWMPPPTVSPGPAPRAGVHRQGPRLLYLHLRHHRPAQGRQFQPYAHAVHDDRLSGARCSPNSGDRIYNPLPLYHATGGVCAVGMALGRGGALIIKKQILGQRILERHAQI